MKISRKFFAEMILIATVITTSLLTGEAQQLSYENTLEVVLSDGVNIKLYGGFGDREHDYRYLPPAASLKLAQREDETPEFLFLKFTSENRASSGGVQGALMHFLMEWGLTPTQMTELEQLVKSKTDDKGRVLGPVDLVGDGEQSFQVVSAVMTDKGFTPNFVTSGQAPPLPGGRAAVAARLDANGAQLLAATFEKSRSITDVSLALNYEYIMLIEAAEGTLTYDWSRLESQYQTLAVDYLRKELDGKPEQMQDAIDYYKQNQGTLGGTCGASESFSSFLEAEIAKAKALGEDPQVYVKTGDPDSYQGEVLQSMQTADAVIGNTGGGGGTGGTYEYFVGEGIMRSVYEFMYEQEIIQLEWMETIPDERLDVIREAFFEYFVNGMTNEQLPEPAQSIASGSGLEASAGNPVKEDSEGAYSLKMCEEFESVKRKFRKIQLKNIRLPVKRKHQMVANLASTYDMVRHNPKCVSSVNLNDPFFQHRDINLILDVEADQMFKEEINYVTVNVRKPRSTGNDFYDAVTFSLPYLKQHGALSTITYARGEDNNPETYYYKAQWSLKGGEIYPENPRWERGDWQGLTLAAPIRPNNVEFESNLNELRELGITRATLQLRYYKFGEETDHMIHLSPAKEETLIEDMIYMDRDSRGYAYRIIYNHKDHGKLATDWCSQINDNYVYAVIPEEWRKEDGLNFGSELLEIAKSKAKEFVNSASDQIKANVLSQFTDLIN